MSFTGTNNYTIKYSYFEEKRQLNKKIFTKNGENIKIN